MMIEGCMIALVGLFLISATLVNAVRLLDRFGPPPKPKRWDSP